MSLQISIDLIMGQDNTWLSVIDGVMLNQIEFDFSDIELKYITRYWLKSLRDKTKPFKIRSCEGFVMLNQIEFDFPHPALT